MRYVALSLRTCASRYTATKSTPKSESAMPKVIETKLIRLPSACRAAFRARLTRSWQPAHELVGSSLPEPELRERTEHAAHGISGLAHYVGRSVDEGSQLIYEDRCEGEEGEGSETDQDHEGRQDRQPSRHQVREPPHREGKGHRQRETAKQHDQDGRGRPHERNQRQEPEHEDHVAR